MLDRDTAETYAGWFRCLADPTRVLILSLLAGSGREFTVGEIVAAMQVGQSTVSHHLKILRQTGFVRVRRQRSASYFRVNQACIDGFPSAAEIVMGAVATSPGALARPSASGCPAPWAGEDPAPPRPAGPARWAVTPAPPAGPGRGQPSPPTERSGRAR